MKQTIHLQYFGEAPAKPAKDFSIGEFMLWNFGAISKVIGVLKETEKTITYQLEYKSFGGKYETGERIMKKDRLVGISTGKYY